MKEKSFIIIIFLVFYSFPIVADNQYPMFGLTLGFPAGWNIFGGYMFENYALFTTGMYRKNDLSGGQINIMKKIYDNNNIIHGISLVAGKEYIPGSYKSDIEIDWIYTGLAYNLFIEHYFFEVGAKYSFGTDEGDYIQAFKYIVFQCGYVFRLK